MKDFIPDPGQTEERSDLAQVDEWLLELYNKARNLQQARKLVGKTIDGLDFVLNDIEHVRLDLEDYIRDNEAKGPSSTVQEQED